MKPATLLLSLACLALTAVAQVAPPVRQNPLLLAELNADIWIPFAEAYNDGDAAAHLALHAPDFIRVEGDRKVIRPLADYATSVRRTFEGAADREEKLNISFRFTERIARGDLASERGIYELVLADNDGNVERLYGRFHTIARKLEGKWRLVVDYDSSEGGAVTRADFLAAAFHEDFKRF